MTHSLILNTYTGMLSDIAVKQWKVRRCDRFFCKPNSLEAKGTYKCEPLNTN